MPLHRPRSETGSGPETTSVTVVRTMNDHGAMTVEDDGTGAQCRVVEYGSPAVRRTFGSLPVGSSVPAGLTALGSRGNAWRATAMGGE